MGNKALLSLIFSVLMILSMSQTDFAQRLNTPSQNSKERKDLLNALKEKVDKDGAKSAIIIPHFLKVKGNWAYLSGLPKKNATEAEYYHNVKALLKKSGGKWSVVKYLVGSHDLATMNWWKEFKAPKALFPYSE